jgi:DNA-binding FadR family transcriptional regulator
MVALPSDAVTRSRVADQIIATLRDRILTGAYPRGSKLPTEKDLAVEFGVSAPTIRESLRALTSLGLVDVRHGSGAYVRTNSDGILGGPLGMHMVV